MFPADREDHRLVAWQNYVAFNAPYNNVLPLLRNEYAWAIAHIGKQPNTRGEEAERALAQHLMAFYWRGQLPLDGLVTDFFVCASDALRAEAIEFVGRSLHADSEVPVPDEILKRLMALWEYRVKCADANIEGFRKELAAFGWWFVAKRFEKGWSTEQLLFVLRKAQKITPDHQIVKQLGSYLDEQPEFVLETLYLIIEADKEGWSFYGFADEAREILLKALKRDDTNFDAAKRIIDLLVIKGHSEYRSLLENGK
jgi:hypothetical protein